MWQVFKRLDGKCASTSADYVAVTRKRQLAALQFLDRRKSFLPDLAKPKMAALLKHGKPKLIYVRTPQDSEFF